jgi:integrase
MWYVRVGKGPRIRIRGVYGSLEFEAAYQAAVSGERAPKLVGPKNGTLGWLHLHRQSRSWLDLSPATRKQRTNILKSVLERAENTLLSSIDKKAIIEGRDRRAATPFQARHFVDSMRAMFQWAVENKLVPADPTVGVMVKKPKSKGFPVWTDADIAAFELRWPRGTRQRVMFDIFCFTGLRRGDAARVGPQHVVDNTIEIDTEKTGMRVAIPLLASLQETLLAGPVGQESFIATIAGKPYVKESLGNEFKEACRAAGINKSAHGLRKAAATRAANNGATERELEAIFGWTGGQMAAHYTRSANRNHLAKNAMSKLEKNEKQTSKSPPPHKVVTPERKA